MALAPLPMSHAHDLSIAPSLDSTTSLMVCGRDHRNRAHAIIIIIIIIIALQHSEELDMVSDEQKLVLNENEN